MSTIELLAPVGHREGLLAAVSNGADAVYIGGASFGARKEAAFSNEELMEAVDFCHLHSVKVYVTVNTTIFDNELDKLTEYIHFLYLNKIDAIIVQDIGVANLVKRLYPDFELHFSTQMTLHNTKGVEFAKNFGANRAVIARENTIEEIKAMSQVGIELEVFVHGALCVCYSGQCLMSSMIGGRSGNRGACAQTCRLPYDLVDLSTGEKLDSNIGNYLLSPRDLKTIDQIGDLIEAGVTSFKIEGRLKKAEYVAAVVRAYREAIDQYEAGKKIQISKEMHDDMDQVFSRGFTKGFLFNESGTQWLSADRPNHRGVLIGKVAQVKGKRISIKLKNQLDLHDGLRFLGDKEFGMQVQKMFVKGNDVKQAGPGMVEMDCQLPITVGMDVYRTTSSALVKRMEAIALPQISIYGEVSAYIGSNFSLSLWDDMGNLVVVSSPQVIEKAENTPLSETRLRQQLEKTGGTSFVIKSLNIGMDEDMTMPISVVNKLRREALSLLEKERVKKHDQRPKSLEKVTKPLPYKESQSLQLAVSVRDIKQLMVVLEQEEVKVIYYKNMKTFPQAFKLAQEYSKTLIPQLSRVMSDQAMEFVLNQLSELQISEVMVGEYGVLEALKHDKYNLMTDFSFNTNNVQSIETLRGYGVKQATLSYEVTNKQIKQLVAKSPLPVEAIVYGRVPMMITKHCPIKAHFQTDAGPCKGAWCMKTPYGLEDRKGKIMPLLRTGKCLTEIFNAQHLILLEYIQELKGMGISLFRIEFTNESPEEIKRTIKAYDQMVHLNRLDEDYIAGYKENQDFTKGHYHRGV